MSSNPYTTQQLGWLFGISQDSSKSSKMSNTNVPVNTKYLYYLNKPDNLDTICELNLKDEAKKKYPNWDDWPSYKKLIKCIPPAHIPRNDVMKLYDESDLIPENERYCVSSGSYISQECKRYNEKSNKKSVYK